MVLLNSPAGHQSLFCSSYLNDFDSPIGGVAAIVLFIFLKLNPRQSQPFRKNLAEFDFIGLVSIVFGNICLLMGLSFAQESCMR